MGLRGPKPKAKATIETPMTATDAPEGMGKDALDYWRKHAPGLTQAGILTGATEDSFLMLCDLWQRYREMKAAPTDKKFLDVAKAYQALAKQFRLLPTEQPKEQAADRYQEKPEFEF